MTMLASAQAAQRAYRIVGTTVSNFEIRSTAFSNGRFEMAFRTFP